MSRTPPSNTALRVADLSQNDENAFELRPEVATTKLIAEELELSSLRKLSFAGRIVSIGKADWQLEARLGATVVQPCVVTLEPVTTRIDIDVVRRFVADYADPDEPEAEMPDDETRTAFVVVIGLLCAFYLRGMVLVFHHPAPLFRFFHSDNV